MAVNRRVELKRRLFCWGFPLACSDGEHRVIDELTFEPQAFDTLMIWEKFNANQLIFELDIVPSGGICFRAIGIKFSSRRHCSSGRAAIRRESAVGDSGQLSVAVGRCVERDCRPGR